MKKLAIITGVTSGIGASCAKLLAERGFEVHGLGRRRDRLEKTSKELGISTYLVDIRDGGATRKFVNEWQNKIEMSRVETLVLVNNAGLAKGLTSFVQSSAEDNLEVLMTNVVGLIEFTRLILPSLLAAKRGHIINLGSVAGRWSYPKGATYCASKAAVHAFSESLRMDLLGSQVRLTEILPGMVNTEFSQVRLGDAAKAAAVYQGMTPLTAEDIGEAVLWAVERPVHVNIQEIVLYPTDQASVTHVHRKST